MIFDLETTELIEDDVAIEDMTASVACAMWLPAANTVDASVAGADTRTFWHGSVTRAPNGEAAAGMRGLLEWFDGAAMIVAYNGRDFDMRVLSGCYRADEEARRQAHMAKLVDPAEAIRRATGRRAKLSTVLRMNTRAEKGGDGCDAPRFWKEGKYVQLQRYCAQDVRVLADLVIREEIRLPGGGVTRGASVRQVLVGGEEAKGILPHDGVCAKCGGPTGGGPYGAEGNEYGSKVSDALIRRLHEAGVTDAREVPLRTLEKYRELLGGLSKAEETQLRSVEVRTEAELQATQRARDAYLRALDDDAPLELDEEAAKASREKRRREQEQGGEHSQAERRGVAQRARDGGCAACSGRKRKAAGAYDETRRRKARRVVTGGYMDRGGREWAGGKRSAIVLGGTAVERIVAGRYEWRDHALTPTRGARKRYWEDMHEPTHRAQRPRTDGDE